MQYFIGIDPSINSTGICIMKYDGDKKIREEFVIIKPCNSNKKKEKQLSKKELVAEDKIINFEYVFYDSEDLKVYIDLGDFREYWKSYNMIRCAKKIKEIIKEYTKDNPEHISICIEGISYGSSIRTKSIYDLAGLNYLVREKFIEVEGYDFYIATPSEIKKFATGKGNNNKEIIENIFLMSHKEFNIIPKLDDIADAYFMARFSQNQYIKNNS